MLYYLNNPHWNTVSLINSPHLKLHKIPWMHCGFVCICFALNVHMYSIKNHAHNAMGALWLCVWIFALNVHMYSRKYNAQNNMGALWFCVWILHLHVHMYSRKNHAPNAMGALYFSVWIFALNVHMYMRKNHAQNAMGALYFSVWILALNVHMYSKNNHAENTIGALYFCALNVYMYSRKNHAQNVIYRSRIFGVQGITRGISVHCTDFMFAHLTITISSLWLSMPSLLAIKNITKQVLLLTYSFKKMNLYQHQQ